MPCCSWTKKSIIVTGAGGGLGEGIARVCHREGARVVIADIRGRQTPRPSPPRSSDRPLADGVRRAPTTSNCNSWSTRRSSGSAASTDWSTTPASIASSRCWKRPADDWQNVLAVDLRAPFFLSQMVCRQMLEQQPAGGSIVNIASVHTHGALPASVTYDAAKWGMVGDDQEHGDRPGAAGHPHQCRLARPGGHADLGRRESGRARSAAVRRLFLFQHSHQPADRAGRNRRDWSPFCSAIAADASSARTSLPTAACRANCSAGLRSSFATSASNAEAGQAVAATRAARLSSPSPDRDRFPSEFNWAAGSATAVYN